MLEGLDDIPWKKLGHAYGSASDVPGLIRELATAPPDMAYDQGPLWKLFGNIWHQGTVYEATAYAVPFLLELAADQKTPDRIGVLHLLASIADGASYLDVHGHLRKEGHLEAKRKIEMGWVAAANDAVAAGFKSLVAMTKEGKGDLPIAAAHVLAQLKRHAPKVLKILLKLLQDTKKPLHRNGLLLLLGQIGHNSPAVVDALLNALKNKNVGERRAAALALAELKVRPLPEIALKEMSDALVDDDLEKRFIGLPWDVWADIDNEVLRESLGRDGQNKAAERLISAIEAGRATHNTIQSLLDVLFPMRPPPDLTPSDLSPLQARAVRAIAQTMNASERIFVGHFPQWGLPDTKRKWRALAQGKEPEPVDETLPVLGDPSNPRRRVRPDRAKVGQRIVHRVHGPGKIEEISPYGDDMILTVDFDDDGPIMFQLPKDGSPYRP